MSDRGGSIESSILKESDVRKAFEGYPDPTGCSFRALTLAIQASVQDAREVARLGLQERSSPVARNEMRKVARRILDVRAAVASLGPEAKCGLYKTAFRRFSRGEGDFVADLLPDLDARLSFIHGLLEEAVDELHENLGGQKHAAQRAMQERAIIAWRLSPVYKVAYLP